MSEIEPQEIDLAGIRARCEAATEGPWATYKSVNGWHYMIPTVGVVDSVFRQSEADVRFIAHAREDIPALLSHVSLQEAEIARLKAERADDADLANGCLSMVREVLGAILGKEAMESTPPMFYPEAIMSACATAARVAHETGNPKPALPLPYKPKSFSETP